MLLYKQVNNKYGEIKIYNNLAVLYEQQNMDEKAIKNYEKALELSKEVNYAGGIAMTLINIAGIYIETNENLEKAKSILLEAEKICIETTDNYKLIFVYGLQGQYFTKKNNLSQAAFYSKKSYDIAVKINVSKDIADLALQLSEIYKKQKNYENSLKYFEIFHKTNDSIYNVENTNIIEEMKNNFEVSEKEKEIKLRENKILMLEKNKRLKTLKNYALIIGLFALLIIIVLILIFFKNKFAKNKLIADKNEELFKSQKKILELELKTKEKEAKELSQELEYKDKEIQSFAMSIVDKNDFIEKIKIDIKKLKNKSSNKDIDSQINSILFKISNKLVLEYEREEFLANVEQINNNFFLQIEQKFPKLTKNEKRIAGLLRIDLHSKEIAAICNITVKSVDTNRYRLRKKLNLDQNVNLNEFFKNI